MRGSPTPTGRLAKTSPPRATRVHARRRLFKRLDAACKQPIAWLTGPAGSGKTTLLSSYVADRKRPCIWYQLDASDRDVAQLFEYLPRALAAAFPRRKAAKLPRFGPENLGGLPAFTRRFFEAVYDALPERAVIVFDNYQEVVADAPWHEAFREALAAVPRGMTAIVASRAEPPPAVARLIAHGTLQRIGWDDLRLTSDETRGIARAHAHSLGAKESTQLHALAEGWAAGLVLLLEQPRLPEGTRGDPASQALFDYFAAEIFDGTEPDTRELLLRTSIVSSVDVDLAQQLCPDVDATRILSRLRREGFFTEYRGDETYQYHPLFRTFLADQRARTLSTEETRALRIAAARLLAERQRADEAIEILGDADPAAKADLVEREAPDRMMQGRGVTVAGWIDGLPQALVESRPWLLLWRGISCLGFAPRESLALVTRAFERFRDPLDPPGLHLAWAAAVQAIVHAGHDFSALGTWIESFETLPPCPAPPIEARVATGMLMALTFWQPGSDKALFWAERAMSLATSADPGHRLVTGGMAVVYHSFFGEHARASSIIDMLRAQATENADALAVVTLRQAESLHAWIAGHDEACLVATDRGLEMARRTGILVWNDQLCAFGASAALSSGDVERAQPYVDGMAAGAGAGQGATFSVGNYHCNAGMVSFARGDIPRAVHDVQVSLDIADTIGYPFARAASRTGLAQISWFRGQKVEARRLLGEADAIVQETGAQLLGHGVAMIGAGFALDEGDLATARALTVRGLEVARERGYFNFWVSREMTSRLAVFALENDIEVDYIRELVRRRKLVPATPPWHLDSWPWRVRMRVLGGLEIDGAKAIKGAPRRLLQAVVALARRSASHEHVAMKLWPDAEGDAARGVFDTTLYRLRKLLPENVLELDGGRVALDGRAVWVDAHAFEHGADELLRAADDDEAAERAGLRTVGLYGGPLFGDDDEPWMMAPRERLRDRFVSCVEKLAGRAARRGHVQAAIELYAKALDVDAAPERLHRGLVAALVRSNRHDDARAAYERCRRELVQRAGVEPAEATRALLDAS